MLTTPIRVVFPCGSFPSPGHINLRDPAREGQMQALPRHDGIQIRVLAQGAPIGLTQRRRLLFAALALGTASWITATKSIANLR